MGFKLKVLPKRVESFAKEGEKFERESITTVKRRLRFRWREFYFVFGVNKENLLCLAPSTHFEGRSLYN